MDKTNLSLEVDRNVVKSLFDSLDFLYQLVSDLPDCIAKKFAFDDLISVESYFIDYLIPIDNGK